MSKPAVPLKAPYPYFGGKSRVAAEVWSRLGEPDNFVEPFSGSAAVLLSRPHPPRIETLNDADHLVANFWRATQRDPEAVAAHADGPVFECDLHARHRWLVLGDHAAEFRRRMAADPEYYDSRVAGYWCWGLCCWIGAGWCNTSSGGFVEGRTAAGDTEDRTVAISVQNGVHRRGRKRPQLCNGNTSFGVGVHAEAVAGGKRNALGNQRGVLSPGRPQLADAYDVGRGVCSNGSLGTCADRRAWLLDWFGRLRDRLRLVRVCCGDWLRVCWSDSVTVRLGTVGLFLDPPYALDVRRMHAWVRHLDGDGPEPGRRRANTNRDGALYATDHAADVDRMVADVHRYCRERGADPRYRIALCGYAGEHDALESLGWEGWRWKSGGGYGNRSDVGKANAGRETIWFSPFTLKPRPSLFDAGSLEAAA